MKMPILYVMTNIVNGKQYVGITKNTLSQRMAGHKCAANTGRKTRIAAAIRKYGFDAFQVDILSEHETYEQVLSAEVEEIFKRKPAYNSTSGGEGVLGLKMTEETRKKISENSRGRQTFLGKTHTEETKEKMRISATGRKGFWAGKKRDTYVIEQMTKSNRKKKGIPTGRKHTQETKDKISAKRKGVGKTCPPSEKEIESRNRNMIGAAIMRRKPIICLETKEIFKSAKYAAEETGISINRVRYSIRWNTMLSEGMTFRYVEDAE